MSKDMCSNPILSKDDYIASLQRRVRTQKMQIDRLRMRGQVLFNLLLEMTAPLPPGEGSQRGKILCLVEDDDG